MPKDIKWPRLLFWVGLSLAAGGISAWLTSGSMDVYSALVPKPPLAPPPIAFPIVWSILYVLMGIAAYLVSVSRGKRGPALVLFVVQLAVNAAWPVVFFNMLAFKAAFALLVLLAVLIAAVIFLFARLSRAAAWLMAPYLVWVCFAGWLNWWFAFVI
ncbi:MAG TPA: tryptophan-rich sensory protein [Firmicutes bacterium]|nr:tryptophan-rich sensory protein [Bacillota bacterium]